MSARRAVISLVLGVCCLAPASRAQAPQRDSVDAVLRRIMHEKHIPGMQVAVVRRGHIVYRGAFGVASLEQGTLVTRNTVFPINSATKAFTGVAIMQLVEAGEVELDAPVGRYLDSLPEAWRAATIRQLLTHTSGLPDVLDGSGNVLADAEDAVWPLVRAAPLRSSPGTEFSYNQTGYVLLGQIIRRRTGLPFTTFIQERQLAVVDMPRTQRTGFVDSYDVVRHGVEIYAPITGAPRSGPWRTRVRRAFDNLPAWLRTAAGMQSTASELARWLIALQQGRLLKSPRSLDALWTPARVQGGTTQGFGERLNGYALGWPVMARAAHPAVGAIGGGRAAFFVYPEDDLAVVILTNLRGAAPEEFVDAVAGLWGVGRP